MFETAGRPGNSFALRLCPTARGQFHVSISPEIPNLRSRIEVSARKIRSFLMKHPRKVAVEQGSKPSKLLVSPVSEEEVRELTDGGNALAAQL
jgi:hypothetical protein